MNTEAEGWQSPDSALTLLLPTASIFWRSASKPLRQSGQGELGILAADEVARASRFSFSNGIGIEYIRGHSALRILLGSYLGVAPAEIRFRYGKYGKPELAPPMIPGICDLTFRTPGGWC